MFSATMPSKIKKLSSSILINPTEISIELSKPVEGVLQAAYLVNTPHKDKLIVKLIKDKPEYNSILIFTSTKSMVNQIVRSMKSAGFVSRGISSDYEQKEREEVLRSFRARNTRVLVATDVLSRGIDIKDINLVINYDVPNDAEDYVHRVGRTARALTTGVALTLINEDDMYKFLSIERLIDSEIHKINLPPEIGESPVWNPKPQSNFRGRGGNKGKGGFKGKSNRGKNQGRPSDPKRSFRKKQ